MRRASGPGTVDSQNPSDSMPPPMTDDLTGILRRAAEGDPEAEDRFVRAVYDELTSVAEREVRKRHGARYGDLTLEPTALVHDTLLKLLADPLHWENRRHFFAYATTVLVRVLQDYQRARRRQKRGGHLVRLTLTGIGRAGAEPSVEPSDLPQVLEELESLDPRKAEVVRLRVFWGLDMAEIAATIEVSLRTVERDWTFARHWLADRLGEERGAVRA